MSTDRELTLRIRVTNLDDLEKLKSFTKEMSALAPNLKSSLSGANSEVSKTSAGFTELATAAKSGFTTLQTEIVKLNSGLKELGKALQNNATADDGTASRKRTKALEEETMTVKKLREELQKGYEKGLVNGATGWNQNDLRLLQLQGVSLSPADRATLDSGKKELAELEKSQKQRERDLKSYFARVAASNADVSRRMAQLRRERWKALQGEQGLQSYLNAGRTPNDSAMLEAMNAEYSREMQGFNQVAARAAADNKEIAARMAQIRRDRWRALQGEENLTYYLNPGRTGKDTNELETLAAQYKEDERRLDRIARSASISNRTLATKMAQIRRERWKALQDPAEFQKYVNYGRTPDDSAMLAAMNSQYAQQMKDFEQVADRAAASNKAVAKRMAQIRRERWRALQGEQGFTSYLNYGRTPEDTATLASMAEYYTQVLGAKRNTTKSPFPVSGTKDIDGHTLSVMKAGEAYQYLHTSMRGIAGGMGQIWLTWGKPMTALWAGFAVSAGVRESIKGFLDFENQLKMIQGVAGESEASVARLGEAALALGRESVFGPQQIAEGMRVLTQAGLSAAETLRVIPEVLQFATVGEMNLDKAAQSLIGIANAFGKPVELMGYVGDVVAKAAAISQTSIEAMTNSVRVSSVVAEQFGAKIEDVSAILAVLAKRNIDGTAAGTAMRNAYKEIYTPTDKARSALQALGITAYDAATKQMKPFLQVMEEMSVAIQGFDKESQDRFFQIIFGERGGKVGSAMLNDLDGIKKAVGQVTEAAGFLDNASLIIESSVKNRLQVALNNLKASFIEAGAAAEGPLRSIAASFDSLANSPQFQQGLAMLAQGLAAFVQVLVENADTILLVFGTYLGVRAVAAVVGVASSLGALIAQYGRSSVVAGAFSLVVNSQKISLDGLAAAASRASVALGAQGAASLAGSMAATTAAAGGLMATLGKSIPVIGTIITMVGLAAAAWGTYKAASDAAANASNLADKSLLDAAESKMAQREKQVAAARNAAAGVDPVAAEESKALDKLFEDKVKAQADIVARIDVLKERRWSSSGSMVGQVVAGVRNSNTNEEIRLLETELEGNRKDLERIAKLLNQNGLLSLQNKSYSETAYANNLRNMKTGDNHWTPPDDGPNGTGSAIGREMGAENTIFSLDLRKMETQYDRANQIVQAMARNRLITEEQASDRIAELNLQRYKEEEDRARTYLTQTLPELEKRALASVTAKGAEGEAQRKAIRATAEQYRTQAEANLEAATTKWGTATITGQFDAQGRRLAFDQRLEADLNSLRERIVNQEIQKDLEANLSLLPQAQRAAEERRLEIVQQFAEMRKKVEANPEFNEERRRATLELYEDLEEMALDSAKRRAEYERSFQFGATRAARSFIDEVENQAKVGEQVVQTLTQGIDTFFVDMATKGKASFSDLTNSVISDLMRMATQAMITKPLMESLFGSGGFFNGGFASSFPKLAFSLGMPIPGLADAGTMAGLFHTGGVIGKDAAQSSRSVPSSVFAGAPRFHRGGVIGRNEVPIIAERGEMVLTEGQQRALGGALSAQSAPQVEVNIINNGTAQEASNVTTEFDGKRMIVNVILEDLSRNGPVSKGIRNLNSR